jgi:tetratricopeptide (TPR) repeat protein
MQDDAPPPADEPAPREASGHGDPPAPADPPAHGEASAPGEASGHGDPPAHGEPPAPEDPPVPEEPESAYELLQRGHALMHGRHNAQAAIVLERAAILEPSRGSILEALGRACFNAGHYDRARAVFEALLEVDPSSHYGHYALAQSLRKLDRASEALTHLRLACAMAPDSALYRGALARASVQRGAGPQQA